MFKYGLFGRGYDSEGFNKYGYDREGYDKEGFNSFGYDRNGYDRAGFDINGYNCKGFDIEGFSKHGYNIEGYSKNGYNRKGYDKYGYDVYGYDKDGFDITGCNRLGYHKLDYSLFDTNNSANQYKYLDNRDNVDVFEKGIIYIEDLIKNEERYVEYIEELMRTNDELLGSTRSFTSLIPDDKFINMDNAMIDDWENSGYSNLYSYMYFGDETFRRYNLSREETFRQYELFGEVGEIIYTTKVWRECSSKIYRQNVYRLVDNTITKYEYTLDSANKYTVTNRAATKQWDIDDPDIPSWLQEYLFKWLINH